MAEIKQALITHLNNDPNVSAAYSNRIWADRVPDLPGGGPQPYPYALIRVIASQQSYSHQGEVGRTPLTQIDVFDDDISSGDTNAEIIRKSLSGFKGQMGNVYVGRCFVNGPSGTWDGTVRNYRRILEVSIGTND
jgi:hypothetical protein